MLNFSVDLSHTPGVNYALAYWMAGMVYSMVLPKRKINLWGRGCAYFALFAALTSFMSLTDGISNLFFVPCMLLDAAIVFFFLLAVCDISLKKALYFMPRAFLLGEFAAALDWQMFYYMVSRQWIVAEYWMNFLLLSGVYLLIFLIGYLMERQYKEANRQMNVSGSQLTITLVLAVSIYTVSNLSFITNNSPFSSSSTSEIFIIRSLVDLGGIGMLFATHMQNQNFDIRLQTDYLQKMLAMQYENYQINEEGIRMVNQKYHDLKHQIALLRSEISTDEKLTYLDELEKDIQSYEAQNKTGNGFLDTILTAKSLQCQRENISLTCTVDGRELNFMNAMDISSLFGNALDNAVEGVRKIADPEKRLIHLTVNRQKNFVRIHVENCYEGEIQMVDGMPVTSKKDKNFHGFGTKSIRTIVDKYGGSMTFRAENGWFELRILFAVQ